ncbi:MAG: YciI family protein [Bacteroidota bacterium]
MQDYLLLIKGKTELDYAPEALQQRLAEYREWVLTLGERHRSDNRLEQSGAHLRSQSDILIDGPFLEAKEVIAGFVILKAVNLEEAIDLAKACPLLHYFEIYVRPMIADGS